MRDLNYFKEVSCPKFTPKRKIIPLHPIDNYKGTEVHIIV